MVEKSTTSIEGALHSGWRTDALQSKASPLGRSYLHASPDLCHRSNLPLMSSPSGQTGRKPARIGAEYTNSWFSSIAVQSVRDMPLHRIPTPRSPRQEGGPSSKTTGLPWQLIEKLNILGAAGEMSREVIAELEHEGGQEPPRVVRKQFVTPVISSRSGRPLKVLFEESGALASLHVTELFLNKGPTEC
eukprot:CAMPEP_0178466938 /NCGR_PEP_ID=MMETSP0689_2-20121128/52160_1 /TAXON_ID=160604 /ORGANISM="Amphidinium massartii, Strain CS-259" /LENGTH=188 /DNA_ID=CAMNT_0020093975 /DNA_START=38 /DNA_END=605 /DNA_ORIENTATION=-